MTLLRREPRNRDHDHVLVAETELAAQLGTAGRELVGPFAEGLDVDGVRKDADALRPPPAGENRLPCKRPDHEHVRRPADESGHHRTLDRGAPAGPRADVVADDQEDVRDVLESAPEERRLCRKGAPAGDDHDVGPGPPQLTPDPRGDGIVVVDES